MARALLSCLLQKVRYDGRFGSTYFRSMAIGMLVWCRPCWLNRSAGRHESSSFRLSSKVIILPVIFLQSFHAHLWAVLCIFVRLALVLQ